MDILQKTVLLGCVLYFLCGQLSAQGYTVSDTVPDFMDLTADCVVATYGSTHNPFANTGIQPDRHYVIDTPGTDPYTGYGLSILPPGESKAIRLGNSDVRNEAESISYYFTVDTERSVLLLKFALVLQDPGHSHEAQPRFVVRILDEYGTLIESCAEYDVSARAGIEGFRTSKGQYSPVQWRDWTTIGLDLSRYANRAVQVQFITYDCAYYGHFGYAYFTASCIPNKLSVDACSGSEVTLSAPAGFAGYVWDDGTLTPSRTVPAGGGERKLSCELTSVTGCTLLLGALLSDNIPSDNLVLYDTICEGDPYQNAWCALPAQNQGGTLTHTTTLVDPVQCRGDATVTLFLTVQQRFYPVTERICQGEDFQKYGFDIRQPAVGVYRDSLHVSTSAGCDHIVALTLYVNYSFSSLRAIQGNSTPCGGSVELYTVPGIDESAVHTWQVPEGCFTASYSPNGEVQVVVTGEAKSGDLIFTGTNGCGSRSVSLPLTPHPVYAPFFTDTICTGTEYHAHGFTLPAIDSAGYYRYTRPGHTVFGCDSNAILELYVYEAPSVRIAAGDSVLCSGSEVTLQAVTGQAGTGIRPPATAIGDIYCTDKTIVKPEEFSASGKTAMGVVFWVHPNGRNGWIVSLKDEIQVRWSTGGRFYNVPGLVHYSHLDKEGYRDTNGYANTAIIRSAGDSTTYPAAYNVDFKNGWYLPAIMQLRQLHVHAHQLKTSLEVVHSEPINLAYSYWSSTIIGRAPARRTITFGTSWSSSIKLNNYVRSIYSF